MAGFMDRNPDCETGRATMVFWRKNKPDRDKQLPDRKASTSRERTVLGRGWQLKGRIYGKGLVILQSVFDGELDIQGRLTVDPTASVKGSFRAEEIYIGGRLDGAVASSRILELAGTARVEGQVNAPRLQMEEGARLNAEVAMGKQGLSIQGLRS